MPWGKFLLARPRKGDIMSLHFIDYNIVAPNIVILGWPREAGACSLKKNM